MLDYWEYSFKGEFFIKSSLKLKRKAKKNNTLQPLKQRGSIEFAFPLEPASEFTYLSRKPVSSREKLVLLFTLKTNLVCWVIELRV